MVCPGKKEDYGRVIGYIKYGVFFNDKEVQ